MSSAPTATSTTELRLHSAPPNPWHLPSHDRVDQGGENSQTRGGLGPPTRLQNPNSVGRWIWSYPQGSSLGLFADSPELTRDGCSISRYPLQASVRNPPSVSPSQSRASSFPLQSLRGEHPEDPSCIGAPCFLRSPEQGTHPKSLPTCLHPSAHEIPWNGHMTAGPCSCHALRALIACPSPFLTPQNCHPPAAAQMRPWAPPLLTISDTWASVGSAHVPQHRGDRQDGAPFLACPRLCHAHYSIISLQVPGQLRSSCPSPPPVKISSASFLRKTVVSWGLFGAFPPPLPHVPKVSTSLR